MERENILIEELKISVDSVMLEGKLVIPENTKMVIVFSHGSGSSRFSPRNNFVARELNRKGMGTLLIDLLTKKEDLYYRARFDIELLIQRLLSVTDWLRRNETTKNFKIAYFGSSTGAASALGAASILGDQIKAVVSRGGRPDLALPYLAEVKAPTLLIVGSLDSPVIEMNKEAFTELGAIHKKMLIVEGASHLFEEPGKLEQVVKLAGDWFEEHL